MSLLIDMQMSPGRVLAFAGILGTWIMTAWLLATPVMGQSTPQCAKTPVPRQDVRVGTFSEGMTMESGQGQDTVIRVKPMPTPTQNPNSGVDVNIHMYKKVQ